MKGYLDEVKRYLDEVKRYLDDEVRSLDGATFEGCSFSGKVLENVF